MAEGEQNNNLIVDIVTLPIKLPVAILRGAGKLVADVFFSDDGRYAHDDPSKHKGKWGKHSDNTRED